MKPIQAFKSSQDLSAAAMAFDIVIGSGNSRAVENDVELLEVMLHFSSAVSQTVTISHLDGADSTNYQFVLDTTGLSSATNYVYRPTNPPKFKRGDTLRVAVGNSGNPSIVAYAKVHMREVV